MCGYIGSGGHVPIDWSFKVQLQTANCTQHKCVLADLPTPTDLPYSTQEEAFHFARYMLR